MFFIGILLQRFIQNNEPRMQASQCPGSICDSQAVCCD